MPLLKNSEASAPKKDIVYIAGNFNTKVGSQAKPDITGSSESWERNDASKHLVQFAMKIDFESFDITKILSMY